jgi:galactokinase
VDVTEVIAQRTGGPADGVWSAPGRVNLIGEHTDYNEGLCLPLALPLRTRVAASRRDDDLVVMSSEGFGRVLRVDLGQVGPGRPKGWAAYVAGVLWALRQAGHDVGGMDLAFASDVPSGAGLSSSAALECSVAAAASDLFGLGLLESDQGRAELAEACVRAENEVAGAATGGMDQAVSLRAREGHLMLLDCQDGSVEHVRADLTGHTLLVIDTRSPHALVDGQYEARRRDCERAAAAAGVPSLRGLGVDDLPRLLATVDEVVGRRARHVLTENVRVGEVVADLARGDLPAVGRTLSAGHASLRDDFEVTVPHLDVAVEAALDAGALGSRMTGGGFGGSTVALVPVGGLDAVRDGVCAAFAGRGWDAPDFYEATPSGPAARER